MSISNNINNSLNPSPVLFTKSEVNGYSALATSLRKRNIDVETLSPRSKSILSKYGFAINQMLRRSPGTVGQAARLAAQLDIEIQARSNLRSDDGKQLVGFAQVGGPIKLNSSLNGNGYAISSGSVEELGEQAFQLIAKAEAAAGNSLPTARRNGTSVGDFGAEVAARATGTLRGDGSKYRSMAEDDTKTVDGQVGEAFAVTGTAAAAYFVVRVLAGISALLVGSVGIYEAVKKNKEKKKRHAGVDSDNGKQDAKGVIPLSFVRTVGRGYATKARAQKVAYESAKALIAEMRKEGVPNKYANWKTEGGGIKGLVTRHNRKWIAKVQFNPGWVN